MHFHFFMCQFLARCVRLEALSRQISTFVRSFPGFSVPVESSGSSNLPLTMTMQSLWPWHHSGLWIINRGLDTTADGLFVGKQGVISQSRQTGLMTCHKYIKRGSVAISSDLRLWPSLRAVHWHFDSVVFFFSFTPPLFLRSHLKVLVLARTSQTTNGFMHSSWGVCVIDHGGQVELLTPHTNISNPQQAAILPTQQEEIIIRRRPQ